MAPGQTTSLDGCHAPREAAETTGESRTSGDSPAGAARVLYRTTRRRILTMWKMAWLKRAGTGRFGKLAARIASAGTMPYHGRAHLADLLPKGFTAATAAISHPGLKLGSHVYLGDNTVISSCAGGAAVDLGDRAHVYGDTFIETGSGGSIRIGAGTHVQPGCHLHAFLSDIVIGERVEIAAGCGFFSYDHGVSPGVPIMDQALTSKGPIRVGDGAWIGHRVTVLQGVVIGEGAVVAAGSVVTRDIPDNAIAAGVPAKVIRFRTPFIP